LVRVCQCQYQPANQFFIDQPTQLIVLLQGIEQITELMEQGESASFEHLHESDDVPKLMDPSVGVKSDFGILISYRIPEECFEEWKRVSKGRPADMSGITYEKFLIRSEDLLRLHSTVRPFP
jgi:hypothetical protein